MVIFHRFLYVYQRVTTSFHRWSSTNGESTGNDKKPAGGEKQYTMSMSGVYGIPPPFLAMKYHDLNFIGKNMMFGDKLFSDKAITELLEELSRVERMNGPGLIFGPPVGLGVKDEGLPSP